MKKVRRTEDARAESLRKRRVTSQNDDTIGMVHKTNYPRAEDTRDFKDLLTKDYQD